MIQEETFVIGKFGKLLHFARITFLRSAFLKLKREFDFAFLVKKRGI